MGKLFGTDGIRGEANRYPMDSATAFAVGQAITYLFRRDKRRTRVIIGKDTRISGYMLESSLEAGITSMGGDPYLVGVLPTPGIAFATNSMRADAGIVISASHNPFQDNGIKIFGEGGYKLSDEQEHTLEDLITGGKLPEMVPAVAAMGRAYRLHDMPGRYTVFLKNTFPRDLSLEGVKIVLDTANGATYKVAPEVFWELGAKVETIHNAPDGLNINENCGSQHTADLAGRVVATGAAVGLAFDGDGDRLIAVDEKGREISGDQILLICGLMLKEQGLLKNNLLVSTVMSNMGLRVACKKYGFTHHAAKVGDRYVLEDMQKLGGILGGEDSGHMIFLNHHTTGDGILTALQLLSAMVRSGKPLSELAAQMDIYPQKLINLDVKSKPDLDTVPEVAEAIRQVEAALQGDGRVLVRYSGTQNMCRVMVEGPSVELTDKYCAQIADVIKKALG
ncbi:Phosphoglucosamine mutase [uncultured delta proteobacterium]|uniref:Phosphoglucosamine mutase n=1 Tax=uncultured delta proteobacterium TaxID=34034 RepID=A0A212JAS9_9DELT|nr:Phosphoglucosamine mutase [uncultured delta proteobacterium]